MVIAPPAVREPDSVVRLRLPFEVDEAQFFAFCQLNPDLRLERNAEGEVEIMPPVAGGGSSRNAQLTAQLTVWSNQNGLGVAFDSSAGFVLLNRAVRSPDAAWVVKSRLAQLRPETKERFLPLCPDFVVELRSPSDALATLQTKLEEYIANGARLGWLLDPSTRTVYVYRPGVAVEVLAGPTEVKGDPELPGFTLSLTPIWEPGF